MKIFKKIKKIFRRIILNINRQNRDNHTRKYRCKKCKCSLMYLNKDGRYVKGYRCYFCDEINYPIRDQLGKYHEFFLSSPEWKIASFDRIKKLLYGLEKVYYKSFEILPMSLAKEYKDASREKVNELMNKNK